MKKTISITIDQEAKEALMIQAKANGLTLSSYINMLGHVYHNILKGGSENE